jgi:hypothetical protein
MSTALFRFSSTRCDSTTRSALSDATVTAIRSDSVVSGERCRVSGRSGGTTSPAGMKNDRTVPLPITLSR